MTLNRRQFLRALSSTALAAPLMTLPWSRSAFAAGGDKRAIFLYMPDGCIPERFHPTGNEFDFELNDMTSPLAPVKQHCVFTRGLTMYEGGSTHEGGVRKVLTGNSDRSLDYFLGQRLGQNHPHRSIHLGVAANFQAGSDVRSVTFQDGAIPVSFNDNPINAFDQIFGGVSGDGGGGGVDAATRRKMSILDQNLADLNRLQSQLGTAERQKLQSHAQSIREIEQRIQDAGAVTGGGGMCTPNAWNRQGFTVPEGYHGYPAKFELDEHFKTVSRLQLDLLVESFKCDLTRIGSLMWSHAVSPLRIDGIQMGHHDTSHYGQFETGTAELFVQYQQYFMSELAYLIQRLNNTPDADGNTMLHNTLIFLFSELGDSNDHDHKDMPFILAGNAGGALQTGRLLDFKEDAHSKLLVSIANMMDVNVNSFGYTGHGSGGLAGL